MVEFFWSTAKKNRKNCSPQIQHEIMPGPFLNDPLTIIRTKLIAV